MIALKLQPLPSVPVWYPLQQHVHSLLLFMSEFYNISKCRFVCLMREEFMTLGQFINNRCYHEFHVPCLIFEVLRLDSNCMQSLHQLDQHINDQLPFRTCMCHGECGLWAAASFLLWSWLRLYNQTDQWPLDVHFEVISSSQKHSVILFAASISQKVAIWASGGRRTGRKTKHTHTLKSLQFLYSSNICYVFISEL